MNWFCFILDLPDEKPRITGVKESYGVGESIRASCTSWQSHPPANLSWFINAEPVSNNNILFITRVDFVFHVDGQFPTFVRNLEDFFSKI
jgi:hypothetical protein